MKHKYLLSCLIIFIFTNICFAEIKQAEVTAFSVKEVSEGIMINMQAENCLKNVKLQVTAVNSEKGIDEVYEISRIYYDIENLTAVFKGIIPLKKNEAVFKFTLSNFGNENLVMDNSSELIKRLERQKEEKIFNEKEVEFQDAISAAEKKEEEKKEESRKQAEETTATVVVLLPLLLEHTKQFMDM